MQIANDPENRVIIKEGSQRRRHLMALFYKYVKEDVTIIPTIEYDTLLKKINTLNHQIKTMNELRQAELDRKDVHRPV